MTFEHPVKFLPSKSFFLTDVTTGNRVLSVEVLRAFAALSVACFHFVGANPATPDGWFKYLMSYGHYGVQIFFVISGFVLPLSMHDSGYKIRYFFHFMAKRLLRLEPTYLVSLILIVGILASTAPSTLKWKQILLHLGFLNSLAGEDWLMAVYWTLAIEFQFYLFFALSMPLVFSKVRFFYLGLFLLSPFIIQQSNLLFHFSTPFVLGIVSYLSFKKQISYRTSWIWLLAAFLTAIFTLGPISAVIGLLTALFILYIPYKHGKLYILFGSISYSFFLLHTIFGSKALNLLGQIQCGMVWLIISVIVALIVSYFTAYIQYRYVEKPFIDISKKIRFMPGSPWYQSISL